MCNEDAIWTKGEVVYIHRTLENHISQASNHFPVVMVVGARQVGKTTILQKLSSSGRTYVSLDDPLLLDLARSDPALFLQRFPGNVLIDEIQYAPGLLPYIKMEVDNQHQAGRFWLTGSQQFHLMNEVTESLAGRVGIIQMLGLSLRERLGRNSTDKPFLPTPAELENRSADNPDLTLKELFDIIWQGSFPGMVLNPDMNRDLFFSSYVQTYLQRDIRDLARVGDEMAFLRFVRACAARSAQMLNVSELARDVDIAPNTAKNWLSILQTSGLVFLLEPYHTNVTKRLIKSPKLYFLDTGLCAWLTEWSSPETLEAGATSGAILETWIMAELLKTWWHHGRRAPFYYYRDKDKKEIDLLIEQDGTLFPLEFKKTASPRKDAVRHFKVLEKLPLPIGPGGVICLSSRSLPLGEDVVTIPVGWI